MVYPVLIVTAEQECYHIKTGRFVVLIVSGKPGEGSLADLPLLEGGDCKLRDAVGKGFTAFDFDKDQCAAILGDDIDFASFAAEVPLDNREAVPFKKCCCQLFTAIADPRILLAFAIFPSHGST